MDQQWFNPGTLPPTSAYAAPSTAPTAVAIRPVLLAGAGRTRKQRGGVQSQQWFDPGTLPPMSLYAAPSTAPTAVDIRPILMAQKGAGRTRRGAKRGGFVPSIMGPFAANAQAAIVPAALYLVYHTMIPKNVGAKVGGLFKKMTRRMRKN